jgi:hypothetical protein
MLHDITFVSKLQYISSTRQEYFDTEKKTSLTPIIKDDARAERKQNMLFSKSDHYNCCNIAGLENTQEFENTTIKNV